MTYTEAELEEIKAYFNYSEISDYVPQMVYYMDKGNWKSRGARRSDGIELYRFTPKEHLVDLLPVVSSNDFGEVIGMALTGIKLLKKKVIE